MKKYIVRLSDEERKDLEDLTRKGKAAAYKIKHVHILRKAEVNRPNWNDERITKAFSVATRPLKQRASAWWSEVLKEL
jgi:hypothetical protein